MSTNCVRCIVKPRTGTDLLCDDCRGVKCQGCGKYYRVDLIVDDALWKNISPKHSEGGLLCPQCILRAIGDEDFAAYRLSKIETAPEKPKTCRWPPRDTTPGGIFHETEGGRS